MSNAQQKSDRSGRQLLAALMIDALEPRRMLAVFTGTDNTDTILITRAGSFTHVNINGSDNSTTDVNITINALGGNDFVLMDYVHPNIVVNLGAGNDRVTYGGPSHDIFGDLPQTLLVGDTGVDTVNFDDSGGPTDTPREYLFDDLAAMNQVLFDFENLELRVRQHQLDQGNLVQFADGFPVSQAVTISQVGGSHPFGNRFFLGTEQDPIDLDAHDLSVALVNVDAFLHLYDQDADGSGQAFSFFTTNDDRRQHLSKGSFQVACTDLYFSDVTVHGGSTADQFGVGGIAFGVDVQIFGGGGDDSLFTNNANGRDNDLDAIAPFDAQNSSHGDVTFYGGDGVDLVDLDDSADQTGDGDDGYRFGMFNLNGLGGGGYKLNKDQFVPFVFDDAVERVNILADAGNSAVTFVTGLGQQVTLNGGAGNDTFALFAGVGLQDCRGTARIVGGAGADRLTVSDTVLAFQAIRAYSFSLSSIGYADAVGPLGSIIHDSTTESFELFQNDAAATTTNVLSRPTGATLNVQGNGGNDTFVVGGGDLDNSGLMSTTGVTLNGGTGNDNITFDDRLDADGGGEVEVYTWTAGRIAKSTLTLPYSAFESQALLAANGNQQFNPPVVNLNAVAAPITSTTITGGANRSCTVNVSQGDLAVITGSVSLVGTRTVIINDQNAGGIVNAYTVTDTEVRRDSSGHRIAYSGVTSLTLNTSAVFDQVSVERTPPGTSIGVNGNAGNDDFFLGGGDLSGRLLGGVFLNGGAGADDLTISNNTDTSPATQTLTASTFMDMLTHTYSAMETLIVNEGSGGTNLAVNSISIATTINGGSGNDHLDVGGGDIDSNILPGTSTAPSLLIDGNGGNDSIRFNDMNDTVATTDLYLIQQGNGFDLLNRVDTTSHVVSWVDIEGVTLDQNNAPQFGNSVSLTIVNLVQTPLRINGNGGPDSFEINDTSTPVLVHTGLGDRDRLSVNGDGDAFLATVVIEQDDDIENLTVLTGGTLRITSGAVVAKTRLGLNPLFDLRGVLDLAGGALISRAGGPTQTTFRNQITAGRNGGAWNGTGVSGAINSSLAAASSLSDGIGYGLGSEVAPTSIGPFTINPGDTLLRYTLDGDADLNAAVDIADFARIGSNFNGTSKVWTTGDANYDNTTDIADFASVAANFNQSVLASAPMPSRQSLFGIRAITLGAEHFDNLEVANGTLL